MKTVVELLVYLAQYGLSVRVGMHGQSGWWASLRSANGLSFEGSGGSPEAALDRARETFERWDGGRTTRIEGR